MGGKQASETLLSIKLSQMEREGKVITPEEQEKLLKEIQERYEREMEPLFAAARLWVDGIIDPVETRKIISRGIEIANNNPYLPKFNVGVIQT
jgi:3-methylcrotonyl-CoA carboxylase beta subunit